MNNDSWLDLAITACRQAGITPGDIEIIATWDQEYCANAVYRLGGGQDGRYLKLFGPTAVQ